MVMALQEKRGMQTISNKQDFVPFSETILDRDRFDMVKQKQMLVLFPNTGQKYSRGAEIDLTSFLTFSCFLTDTH
jgi:hypothetical protein